MANFEKFVAKIEGEFPEKNYSKDMKIVQTTPEHVGCECDFFELERILDVTYPQITYLEYKHLLRMGVNIEYVEKITEGIKTVDRVHSISLQDLWKFINTFSL
ncbi:MAG TPA: hypothetical protein VLE02_01370 [Nitrosarchaeum sp.]|nr:hypothetical protein [Nitrosarchaeum sp.]